MDTPVVFLADVDDTLLDNAKAGTADLLRDLEGENQSCPDGQTIADMNICCESKEQG